MNEDTVGQVRAPGSCAFGHGSVDDWAWEEASLERHAWVNSHFFLMSGAEVWEANHRIKISLKTFPVAVCG